VPIGAAVGLVWLRGRLGGRAWLGRIALIGLSGWMIVGALLAWGRQAPFVSTGEAEEAIEAATIVRLIPPGTPVLLPVDDGDPTSTFLLARAANVARAALPPSRAEDVFVFVGTVTDLFEGRPTERGDAGYDAISRLTLSDIPDGPEPVVIVLPGFYRTPDALSDPRLHEFGSGVLASLESSLTRMPAEGEGGSLGFGPSSGLGISASAIAILLLLLVLGFGYARAVFEDVATALATAPAFGAAAITVAAVALDRLGLRLHDLPVALVASALAGLAGLAVFLVKGQRDRQATA
jgi:hypothetical protein